LAFHSVESAGLASFRPVFGLLDRPMCWLESGPLPDWIAEDADKRFGDLAEAWAEIVEHAREISPRMEDHELRALRMVFYNGARTALGMLPESRNCSHFEELMGKRWSAFAIHYVLPFMRPVARPVIEPEALFAETAAALDHQRGYWQAGVRGAILCLRAGVSPDVIKDEIKAVSEEVLARRARAEK